jgi:hypothetical protein
MTIVTAFGRREAVGVEWRSKHTEMEQGLESEFDPEATVAMPLEV